jgi:hypothetical protein
MTNKETGKGRQSKAKHSKAKAKAEQKGREVFVSRLGEKHV